MPPPRGERRGVGTGRPRRAAAAGVGWGCEGALAGSHSELSVEEEHTSNVHISSGDLVLATAEGLRPICQIN
ncbi:hypothetical protein PVAP13_5NG119208 [Panicum virgatum]|uniref:Uncharacterized protein n=1 Tax=Panicum virgatum TaxID=38727 RepID=A0A8T0RPT0_PANVG|nr:hypothetical protein PVAP13_5NG119208 [Panicum virgatum]